MLPGKGGTGGDEVGGRALEDDPATAALAIGFTLAAIHLVGIPLTGTSVNPARTFGPDLIASEGDDVWIFLTAPFVGGVLGALAYRLTGTRLR